MKLVLEIDEVRDQQRATVIAAVELRKTGLRWQRRKGVEKMLGFDPAQDDSEGEEEAVAAGRAMRVRERALLTQVPELPDKYDPTSVRASSPQSQDLPAKRRRVHLASTSDAEDMPTGSNTQPDTTAFRLNSESETEHPPSSHPDTDAPPAKLRRVRLPSNSDEECHPLRIDSDIDSERAPLERSDPSHGLQRSFSSDDDESIGPSLGIVRRGRGGRRRCHARTRRRAANPFIQFEAKEGDDEESSSDSETSPRAEPAKNTLPSPVSSDADSDSDTDSVFDSDSD